MKINFGKWFKRQVLGGKPVTLGNAFVALAKPLGYSGTPEQVAMSMALDVAAGKLKAKDVEATATAEGKRLLADAIGEATDKLLQLNASIANAVTVQP